MHRDSRTAPLPAKRRALVAAAVLAAAAASAPTVAGAADAAAGKAKAQACAVCHGPIGVSNTPDVPHLAGQPEIYLAAQLAAYKSGARKHEVMSLMAQTLSDADIANVAAWFASIRVQATPP